MKTLAMAFEYTPSSFTRIEIETGFTPRNQSFCRCNSLLFLPSDRGQAVHASCRPRSGSGYPASAQTLQLTVLQNVRRAVYRDPLFPWTGAEVQSAVVIFVDEVSRYKWIQERPFNEGLLELVR
jgi:hypothetical protein